MIEIRRILCPIDFSDYSRRALDHAIAIARWYGSTVTALHVFPLAPVMAYPPGAPGYEPFVLTSVDRSRLLEDMKSFIAAESAPGVSLDAVIRQGSPATEILDHAGALPADLLVIGTHGRSGFERLLLGSVTERVLRKATCPVLTVPRGQADAVPAAPVLFRQILCPVDFSASSMHALNHAMSMAQEADAHLTVLHVMTYEHEYGPEAPGVAAGADELTLARFRQQYEDNARQRLREAVPDTVAAYCSVDTMITGGKPGHEILRVATDRQSDLIVIGVQGRGVADLMFFGSTTQQVVRQAACPVLTLRQA